jgi:hypothetical protein
MQQTAVIKTKQTPANQLPRVGRQENKGISPTASNAKSHMLGIRSAQRVGRIWNQLETAKGKEEGKGPAM